MKTIILLTHTCSFLCFFSEQKSLDIYAHKMYAEVLFKNANKLSLIVEQSLFTIRTVEDCKHFSTHNLLGVLIPVLPPGYPSSPSLLR